MRALSRIGYPKANEFEGDNFEWLFDWYSLVPSWSGFAKIPMLIEEEEQFSSETLR